MNPKDKNRLASEQGFTLIELLVVIIIIGVLVAIAVPAYLTFSGNANKAAAQANVRSAIPAAEGYFKSNNSSYTGMTTAGLIALTPGIDPSLTTQVGGVTAGDSYCLQDTKSGKTAYYIGGMSASRMTADPGAGKVAAGTCPATLT